MRQLGKNNCRWWGKIVVVDQTILFGFIYYENMVQVSEAILWSVTVSILLLMIIASSFMLLKNKIKETINAQNNEVEVNRIKHSPVVFSHLLTSGKHVDISSFEQELFIGDKKAPINILMVVSLGCSICSTAFEQASQLVNMYPQQVNLTLRLLLQRNSFENHNLDVRTHLLYYWQKHIKGKPDEEGLLENFFLDWYNHMDFEVFSKKYDLKIDGDHYAFQDLSDRLDDWIKQAEITKTPTFYINGYEIPENYSMEDLVGMVPGLVAHLGSQLPSKQSNIAATKGIGTK